MGHMIVDGWPINLHHKYASTCYIDATWILHHQLDLNQKLNQDLTDQGWGICLSNVRVHNEKELVQHKYVNVIVKNCNQKCEQADRHFFLNLAQRQTERHEGRI